MVFNSLGFLLAFGIGVLTGKLVFRKSSAQVPPPGSASVTEEVKPGFASLRQSKGSSF